MGQRKVSLEPVLVFSLSLFNSMSWILAWTLDKDRPLFSGSLKERKANSSKSPHSPCKGDGVLGIPVGGLTVPVPVLGLRDTASLAGSVTAHFYCGET